jgi:hypothetical protein
MGRTSFRASNADKSAKGRHQPVSDFRFTHGDPDPVRPEAGEGLATAYRETMVSQCQADPARFAVAAYATGVN